MSGDLSLNFLSKIGKNSIFFVLAAPIYVFSTNKYKDPYKLAISILIISVVITTYFYWGYKKERPLWKILDRLVASSIVTLTFIEGDKYIRGFLGASIFLFFLGQSGEFKSHYSYINHIGFRSFGAIAILLYLASGDGDVQKIFLSLNIIFTFFLVYISINELKIDLNYTKKENFKESSLIF